MGEEYAGTGMIEIKGFEAEFDGWEYPGIIGSGMLNRGGAGYSSIVVGVRC